MALNHQQQAAVDHQGGHLLLLAGAGSGKTKTLVGRVVRLIRAGTPPERILVLTFTNRAANEMQKRIRTEVGAAAKRLTAGTFHKVALQVMRRLPRTFGLDRLTILDRDDQEAIFKLVRGEMLSKDEQKDLPKPSALLALISYARSTRMDLRTYLERHTDYGTEQVERIAHLAGEYKRRKQARSYLDFDDILERFLHGLETYPELRDQLRGLWDHILVDELQDTNPIQFRILDLLRDPAHLFAVGDDAQSIYAFRGADYQNVASFRERIDGAEVQKLTINYRSRGPILDLANAVLADSPLPYDKALEAARPEAGAPPTLLEFPTESQEADWIVTDLMGRRANEDRAWHHFMVLLRSGFAGRTLEAKLAEAEVPYQVIGGQSMLAAAHVKDLFALLRAAQDPSDEIALMRYLTLWSGVGDKLASKAYAAVAQAADGDAAVTAVRNQVAKAPEAADFLGRVRAQGDSAPDQTLRLAESLLHALLAERYDNYGQRRQDIEVLADLASDYTSLTDFLHAYALEPPTSTQATATEDSDVVTLITVHSAKGTEAPICYLPHAQPNQYPHSRSLGDETGEEEERRILYVAVTRAMDDLVVTRNRAGGFTGGHEATASRPENQYFLARVPESVLPLEAVGAPAEPAQGLDDLVDIF